jgi:hypothetical protein
MEMAAIPLYRNQVLSASVQTLAVFGGSPILNRRCEPARQAA